MQALKDAVDDVLLILAVLLVVGVMAQGKDSAQHQPDNPQAIPTPNFAAIEWPTCDYRVVVYKNGGGEVHVYGHKSANGKQTFSKELSVRPLTQDGVKQVARDCEAFYEQNLVRNLALLRGVK